MLSKGCCVGLGVRGVGLGVCRVGSGVGLLEGASQSTPNAQLHIPNLASKISPDGQGVIPTMFPSKHCTYSSHPFMGMDDADCPMQISNSTVWGGKA